MVAQRLSGIFWLFAFCASFMSSLVAATFELNTTRGLWQLDGSLAATHTTSHLPLSAVGFTIGSSPNSRFLNDSGNQYLRLNSSSNSNVGLTPAERFLVNPRFTANGPVSASYVNEWTIVMDVRFPNITNYVNILQDRTDNGDEGEIFLDAARRIQMYGATLFGGADPIASNALAAGTWNRLAFTSTYDAANDRNVLRVYINGVITTQTSAGNIVAPRDGRYGLGGQFALFSDDNNETAITDLGSLSVWQRALSTSDIQSLGAYVATGLTWTGITPATGTPPLPVLTGNIYFGDFLGRYVPPTGAALIALANSARAPTNSSYVCEVTLPLGANGGTVTGFPNHTFGGNINIGILPNGDAIALEEAALTYTTPNGGTVADVGSPANVTFVRGPLALTASGLVARSSTLYFPAGMSVGVSATDLRHHDHVSFGEIALNQSLAPKTNPQIFSSDFPDADPDLTTIYPCTERIPVRFACSSITWSPAAGQFFFNQIGEAACHQLPQLARIATSSTSIRNREFPLTNDLYFRAAKNVTGGVVFGTRAGGIATVQSLALGLDASKGLSASLPAATHYPIMAIAWTGTGNITWLGNSITSSSVIPNARTTFMSYRRNLPVADCAGVGTSAGDNPTAPYFLPTSRNWLFSPDGGLRAEGTIGSGYNSATDTPTGSFSPTWVGYNEGGTNYYGQTITTGFTTGRMLIAGQSVIGTEVDSFLLQEHCYGLLYAGHSSPASIFAVERPGTVGYDAGNADYPGLNLRATPGTYNVTSRIAGTATPSYPLASTAKYYIRYAGLSGLHSSASGSPISLAAYGGAVFNLSALQLSYLDGRNRSSGVSGNVTVPTPESTSFSLNLKRVLLGPQGQIAEAKMLIPQPNINLGYWNFTFTPQSIDFPQPKGCPPPSPSEGFVRLTATATLPAMVAQGKTVTGTLGFYAGDLVTESLPVAVGYPKISRFEPGSLLTVPGPNGKNWNVNCTSGIYLNQKAASSPDPASLNAAGLMDLPFFNDMQVHLRTPSSGGGPPTPLLHVRAAISDLTTTADYDPSHRGRPDVLLAAYLDPSLSYNPVARRKWQGIVEFNLPVAFQNGSSIFRSQAPASGDVLLFSLSEAVKSMTPDNAELLFDGQASVGVGSFLPQLNFSTLLGGAVIPSVNSLLTPAVNALKSLDKVSGDQIRSLVQPALSASATTRASASFYTTLSNSADRAATIDSLLSTLTGDVTSIFGSSGSGINGQARRSIEAELDTAISGLNTAQSLVTSAANFQNLASGIATFLGEDAPSPVDPVRLAELKIIFDRAIADITTVRSAIGSPLDTSINQSSGGSPLIRGEIDKALKDLRQKWVPQNSADAAALYASNNAASFAADLSNALADRVGGSTFAGQANAIIRQQVADAQFLSRQVLDDTLALASSLISLPSSPSLPALGDVLGDKLAAASLKGYAHIKGDSMEELRLDGKASLNVGDKMEFTAFFLLKSVDTSTPAGACLAAGGAKAEVTIGAATNLSWTGQDVDISLAGKVAFDSVGDPTGFFGDLKLVGELDFSEVKIKELALGFGFGINSSEALPGNQNQYYFYGKASGKTVAMDVAAGIFFGRTCSTDPIKNADPDIGRVVSSQGLQPPYTGAAIYAFGGISLMPIIGIPPSCLLDLRVGGGQGFFAFNTGPSGQGVLLVGFKTTQSVTGELLCLASVTGQQDTVIAGTGEISGGSPRLLSVTGDSRFTASGKVGIGFLSYTFKKSVGVIVTANPKLKFRIDY